MIKLSAFVVAMAFAANVNAQSASEQLQTLLSDSWEFTLQQSPTFATRVGDHRWNDQLSDESIENHARRQQQRTRFFDRWQNIDRGALGRDDQIDYDIFGRLLGDQIAEHEFGMHLIPISNRWGFHVEFAELPGMVPLETRADYENYISRLQAFREYAQDHLGLLRAGMEQQLVLPAVVMEGYQDSITAHIVSDPTKSLFYAPLESMPERVAMDDRPRLRDAAKRAITGSVVPAYQEFLDFMRDEYLPACRGSIGASALPNGRDFYRHRVRRFTTLDVTPDEVHRTGLSEVARIRAEMLEIIAQLDFDGNFDEFVAHLRSDSKFVADSPDALLRRTALVLKKMDGKLPQLFRVLPRTPYGIRTVPEYIAPKTTTAYYMPPAGDGTDAGYYYVNVYNLRSRPLYEVEALSLHEAVPGHHLQIALQQEMQDIPEFRRFAGITAFIEGWGLYAERLGLEVGFYTDPYSNFGRLTYEMWRACRLVVDTGMHYLGWTRRQAIDFMSQNTALSLHNIEAEVDRYIAWPGQALAYKTGEMKIRELRALATKQLGDGFDIREFHDVVLGSGAVPLTVLEANVQAYIEKRKAGVR